MNKKLIIFGFLGLLVLWCFLGGFMLFAKTVFSYADKGVAYQKKSDSQKFEQPYFVAYQDYQKKNSDVRVIALYLPQYHQFVENNEWHGRGFTEWTNVTAAHPLFEGHYQPKLPIDVGFYDLTHTDVMKRQIELAQNYGVNGFAFYYYWFSGKKLMEKPIYNYLNDKSLDFPFCLTWANESWSKKWDGGNQELLIEQKFTEDDFEQFAQDLMPFFKDSRYIKVNGRPLFVVYRPALMEKWLFKRFVAYLKQYCKEHGVNEPYLLATKQFGFWDNPKDWDLDAVMDFEINNAFGLQEMAQEKFDDKADFTRLNWGEYVNSGKVRRNYAYKTMRTVFPRWDNTPRKAYSGGVIFDGSTPEVYGKWLDYAFQTTRETLEGEERLLFINAWNEWGEGAMLEPDSKYGYAYLDVTKRVIDGTFVPKEDTLPVGIVALTGGRNRIAKAVDLLNTGKGSRLLISGVRPGTSLNLIASREDVLIKEGSIIDLGYQATDTVGNAIEVKAWAKKHNMDKLKVVTSFYHIPRARLELEHALPDVDIEFYAAHSPYVVRHWWRSSKSFWFLMAEYAKFLAVYLQYKVLGM